MSGTQIQTGYAKMINTGAMPYWNASLEKKSFRPSSRSKPKKTCLSFL